MIWSDEDEGVGVVSCYLLVTARERLGRAYGGAAVVAVDGIGAPPFDGIEALHQAKAREGEDVASGEPLSVGREGSSEGERRGEQAGGFGLERARVGGHGCIALSVGWDEARALLGAVDRYDLEGADAVGAEPRAELGEEGRKGVRVALSLPVQVELVMALRGEIVEGEGE